MLVSASAEAGQRVSAGRQRSGHDSRTSHAHVQCGTPSHSGLATWALSRDPRLEGHWQDPNCPQPLESPPSVPLTTRKSLYLCFPPEKQEGCDPNPGPWPGGGWGGAVPVDLVRQEGWWLAVPTGCPGRPRPLHFGMSAAFL